MLSAERLIKIIIKFFCYLTVLLPIPQLPILSSCLRIAMFAWLGVNFYRASAMFFLDVEILLSDIVGIILFQLSLFTYTLSIVEAMVKRRKLSEINVLRSQIHTICARHLRPPDLAAIASGRVCVVFLMLLLCECVELWVIFNSFATPVTYPLLLIDLGTNARFLQILTTLMDLNLEAKNIIKLQRQLIAQNKRKSLFGSDVWRPYTSKEYEQLNLLRLLYGQLYNVYGCVERCFGWSMFMIIMEKFFFFVCNFFWCVQMYFEKNIVSKLAHNLSKALIVGILLASMCAVTSDMEAHSRYIGCLIFKLSKPLGNKRYNDLVTNFSLQALHQRVSINAKHFFVVNRTLLGSMFGAIITYSVILLQFLFVEQEHTKEVPLMIMNNMTTSQLTAIKII